MLLFLTAAWAHVPDIYTAGPDDDWCAVIDSALGGDFVMLLPGDYTGPCDIVGKLSDPVGEVTIVQSFDATQPARFVHDGSSDYVLSVTGEVVSVLQVRFGEVPAGVAAVELREGTDLTVRYNTFEGGGGDGIVQVGDIGLLRITDNRFEGLGGAPFSVGCDGGCAADSFAVDGNLMVDGGGVGRVVAGTEGEVADNGWFRHDGEALFVDAGRTMVDSNYIDGDAVLTASEVRNTIITGDLQGTVASLRFNTLLGEVAVEADSAAGNATMVADLGGGGVVCDATCFVDVEGRDYFPAAGSPLRGAVPFDGEVRLDWCGNERRDPSSAGAVEGIAVEGFGAVEETYKALQDCSVTEQTGTVPTVPTTADTASEDTGAAEQAGGDASRERCGCTSGARPWAGGLIALVLIACRRRSPAAGGGVTPWVG